MSRPTRAGSAGRNLTIRITDWERDRWSSVAARHDLSLSDWLRTIANRTAAVRPNAPLGGNSLENTGRSRRNPRRKT